MISKNSVSLISVLGAAFIAASASAFASSTKSCGLSGDFKTRIWDCATVVCTKTLVEKRPIVSDIYAAKRVECADPGEGWILVTRTPAGQEFWLDTQTGLVWSPRFDGRSGYDTALSLCTQVEKEFPGSLPLRYGMPSFKQYETAVEHGLSAVLSDIIGSQRYGLRGTESYWTRTTWLAVLEKIGFARAAFQKTMYFFADESEKSDEPEQTKALFFEHSSPDNTDISTRCVGRIR